MCGGEAFVTSNTTAMYAPPPRLRLRSLCLGSVQAMPRTTIGPWAYPYCKFLRGGVFL